jgi:hypothetical protein
LRVLLDQVEKLHFQTLNFSFLVIQRKLDLLNLLLDQTELLICEISILWTKFIKIEFLLFSSRSLHFSLFLVDSHVQDFIKVWNTLQNSGLDNMEHYSILEFDRKFISHGLISSCPLFLIFIKNCGIS